jgi:restriction endonuclease S subunit
MSEFHTRRLDSFTADGSVLLGRGDIISKEDIEAHPGPYPIYSSSAQGNGKFGEYGKFMFDEELITWSVDGGGYFFYRDKHRYSVTNVCGYMRVKSSKLHPKFVFYSLANQHRYQTFDYTTKAHPSVIQKLYWFPTIGYEQQQKIASILTGIDTAIEKTETLIAKYQQIKVGLMHDLFTRGVLPDGKLRPHREQVPELYQETAIGWIPKEWRFTTCSKVCEKIIDCKNRTPPETPDGFPVIRTPNVRDGEFVDAELLYTDERSYVIWTMRGKPQVGDIVITREAPVGEVCMIPERHPAACLGQRMMLYRPNQQLIDPRYFLYALQSRPIQNRLELISGGSTVGHVRVGDIRDLWMFMPESPEEQRLIASALDGISEKLRSELAQREKLQQKKSGLMHDLLTGKVPVKVEDPEVVDD